MIFFSLPRTIHVQKWINTYSFLFLTKKPHSWIWKKKCYKLTVTYSLFTTIVIFSPFFPSCLYDQWCDICLYGHPGIYGLETQHSRICGHYFGYWSISGFHSALCHDVQKRQSHYREVPRWEIFMEQELRFGMIWAGLHYWKKSLGWIWATFEAVFFIFSWAKKIKKKLNFL